MKKNARNSYLLAIAIFIGFIFLKSGLDKLLDNSFIKQIPTTLRFFSSENPYPFIKVFLTEVAVPNAFLFGILTILGELLVGSSIILGVVYLLVKKKMPKIIQLMLFSGLLGAIFLNTVFWFSSGWTSSAVSSLNLLMLATSLVLLIYLFREDKK